MYKLNNIKGYIRYSTLSAINHQSVYLFICVLTHLSYSVRYKKKNGKEIKTEERRSDREKVRKNEGREGGNERPITRYHSDNN